MKWENRTWIQIQIQIQTSVITPIPTLLEHLIAYSLTVTVGNKTHTTAWTNTSRGRPDTIAKIVDSIRRITAKEKVV